MIFAPTDIKTDVTKYETQIVVLESKIDSLHAKNTTLEVQADSLVLEVAKYDRKIKNLNTKIMLSKKKHRNSLMLLILSVMMSWNSFSQTVTDTTRIVLTKPIAKLVVKDLISFDGLEKTNKTLNQLIEETNNRLDKSLKLNTNLSQQVKNYQLIISDKDVQLQTSDVLSKELQKELKKEARAKKLYKIGSGIGVFATLLLLAQ
tara:strand:- start:61 stop:672 length:612 start_codon:yes stop_codon:yes gene_type:complete